MPWGLLQCVKGIPVLFVQNESMYQLQARAGFSENSAEKASGFIGGASIALFVNPMQKVKVRKSRNEYLFPVSVNQFYQEFCHPSSSR